jgi:hypothetical protein
MVCTIAACHPTRSLIAGRVDTTKAREEFRSSKTRGCLGICPWASDRWGASGRRYLHGLATEVSAVIRPEPKATAIPQRKTKVAHGPFTPRSFRWSSRRILPENEPNHATWHSHPSHERLPSS